MDPEEAADALVVRARGHVRGDLEVVVQVPRAGVDDAEDDKVLGLDVVEVGLVRNAERTAGRVVDVVGVDGRGGLTGASQVGVEVPNVATVER